MQKVEAKDCIHSNKTIPLQALKKWLLLRWDTAVDASRKTYLFAFVTLISKTLEQTHSKGQRKADEDKPKINQKCQKKGKKFSQKGS